MVSRKSVVSTIVNLAEEAKVASEGVKSPPRHAVLSICKSLVAVGVAGGVSRTAVAPLERLKILLQVQNPQNIKYNDTIQGLKYIWRTVGLRGLFKGNGANCARIVPQSSFLAMSKHPEEASLTPVLRLGAGACAGIVAMSATYPMDMVRGRITVQTEKSPYQYRGMIHAQHCWETTLLGKNIARKKKKLGFERRWLSSYTNEERDCKDFVNYLENLKNYEKSGVPKAAGTDSDDGFDMERMKRLMERLGNPQSKFKAVHIAGTKGKGSTAAFLSNILREEGYSVGCYTSPHLWSIRERITLGRNGDPVSAEALNSHFLRVKNILDQAIELENGSISHFEVLTAMAFTIFAQENVDIAIVEAGLGGVRDATNVFSSSELTVSVITTIGEEHLAALGGSLESIAIAKSGIIKHGCPVVLGGPFEPHIECILRDKASSMCSAIVLASASGIRSSISSFKRNCGKPYQSCDILVQFEDEQLFIELFDVGMCMLGNHQLQNAVTATCVSLCLRGQGWRLSDESIRTGLEHTSLPGRSQFLTSEEAEALGLAGAIILIDGAHTKESARGLANTINLTHPDVPLALVVAMANDKDHLAFAGELLSGKTPVAVFLTEVSIAGDKSRMTSASLLKEAWVQATTTLDISLFNIEMGDDKFLLEQSRCSSGAEDRKTILNISKSVEESMKFADQILKVTSEGQSGLIVVTGSLHIVSTVLASLKR